MPFKKLKIFLAEHDEDDREIFKLAISQIDVNNELTMFKNGRKLITNLRNPDFEIPHILFLDLNMPSMNGFECLKKIKEDPGLKGITVVIFSTTASDEDIERTFLEGANIYVKKPNEFETLKGVLKKILTIDWQYHTSILNRENFLFKF